MAAKVQVNNLSVRNGRRLGSGRRLAGDRKGRTCTYRKGLGWPAVNPECGILLPGELRPAPSSAAATSPSPASGHGDSKISGIGESCTAWEGMWPNQSKGDGGKGTWSSPVESMIVSV